jgi:nucleoside-diphosphate-sugar epimerase
VRVALTGAAGFIGSSILRELVSRGHHVVAIDNLSTGKLSNIEDVECAWIKQDAGTPIDQYKHVDAIVHAAAHADIRGNWTPEGMRAAVWEENVDVTRYILDQAPRGIPFVLLSTAAVYGRGDVDEDSPVYATSPYAASKLAAEHLVEAYSAKGLIRGYTLRLTNVVGPRYAHGHIADFVSQAKSGMIRPLTNGHKASSFVHVRDVADAACDCTTPNAWAEWESRRINVTSRYVWSWHDTVAVMRAMRPDLPFDLHWPEDVQDGWVGDPGELVVSSLYRSVTPRSVVDGVREALEGVEWSKQS